MPAVHLSEILVKVASLSNEVEQLKKADEKMRTELQTMFMFINMLVRFIETIQQKLDDAIEFVSSIRTKFQITPSVSDPVYVPTISSKVSPIGTKPTVNSTPLHYLTGPMQWV